MAWIASSTVQKTATKIQLGYHHRVTILWSEKRQMRKKTLAPFSAQRLETELESHVSNSSLIAPSSKLFHTDPATT